MIKRFMFVLKSVFLLYTFMLFTSAFSGNDMLSFSLQSLDENNKVIDIDEKSWPNSYLLIAVGFTSCPDICPTTLLDIGGALKKIEETKNKNLEDVKALFITIDPKRDSLKNLKAYTNFFNKDIVGLRTSDISELNKVIKQLGATYGYKANGKSLNSENLPDRYDVFHSTYVYLYSKERKLLDIFSYNLGEDILFEKIKAYIKH